MDFCKYYFVNLYVLGQPGYTFSRLGDVERRVEPQHSRDNTYYLITVKTNMTSPASTGVNRRFHTPCRCLANKSDGIRILPLVNVEVKGF